MFALQILVILHVLLSLIVNPMAFFFLLYSVLKLSWCDFRKIPEWQMEQ